MSLYDELVKYMNDNYNANSHVNIQPWELREIFRGLCNILDKKSEKREQKNSADLICNQCGRKETPPYAEDDECYCGGKFING